jgi:hypothetical protein
MLAQDSDSLRDVGISEVVAAGAKRGRGSLLERGQNFVGEAAQVHQIALEEALDAIAHTIDAAHTLSTRLADYPDQRRVDRCRCAARLTDDKGSGSRWGGSSLINRWRLKVGLLLGRRRRFWCDVDCLITGEGLFAFGDLPRFGTDIHALLLRKKAGWFLLASL